jgi:hypothetical protein
MYGFLKAAEVELSLTYLSAERNANLKSYYSSVLVLNTSVIA